MIVVSLVFMCVRLAWCLSMWLRAGHSRPVRMPGDKSRQTGNGVAVVRKGFEDSDDMARRRSRAEQSR